MSRLTQNPYYRQYSPLFMGAVFVIVIYIGLAILLYQVSNPSIWLWFTPFTLLIAAIIIQLSTTRIIYIRVFQFTVMSSTAIIFGISFWLLIANDLVILFKWITAFITGVILISICYSSYHINSNREYLVDLPHGPVGILDHRTGFVNPYKSPHLIQRQQNKFQRQELFVWRLAPLTAGMTMIVVRGLPDSALIFLIILLCLIVAVGASGGAGGTLYYAIASRRWEIQNGKLMVVKK